MRRSLEASIKSLRRFLREAEQSGHSDLESLDAAALRGARQQLHQVAGALSMVGLQPAGGMVRGMETAVQKLVMRPSLCTVETVATLERATFAIGEYLDAVLAGKAESAVGLFPQYREVQALAGADRAHPADLWSSNPAVASPVAQDESAPLAYGSAARHQLDQAVLRVVKSGDPVAARQLAQLGQRFAAAHGAGGERDFWLICSGFFEAQALGLLPADLHAKRAASRVLMQYTDFVRGDVAPNVRLQQDLLFFCAHARPDGNTPAPALRAVRAAWGFDQSVVPDYEQRRFGRFDPSVLAQARKRIGAAAETWSALAGGDRQKLRTASDQFSLVAESLRRLHPQSAPLAEALTHALDVTQRSGDAPGTALAMEVATSVLYLQAAYEELDTPDAAMAERASVLAARLSRAVDAAAPEPLDRWMEDLYRRVSDRQTMGSVVEELHTTLRDAEQSLDQFFRDPGDTKLLSSVPGHLLQMRGVLSVLGLDQASLAVARMRDGVDNLLIGAPLEPADRAALFDSLAANLGALGFLIDMLGYQPSLARKLFIFDENRGELRVIMGRPAAADAAEGPAHAVPSAPGKADPASDLPTNGLPAPEPATERPADVAGSQASASTSSAATGASTASVGSGQHPAATSPAVAGGSAQPSAQPASAASSPAVDGESDEDDLELREIFLEEAREVVANGRMSIRALDADPADLSEQTTLRRAFHTLKGSARMVQLFVFGDAAWAMEQLFNAWLAEQKAVPETHRRLADEALFAFGRWVEDIADNQDGHWSAQPFQASADALRLGQAPVDLALPETDFVDTVIRDEDDSPPAHSDFQSTQVFGSAEEAESTFPQLDASELRNSGSPKTRSTDAGSADAVQSGQEDLAAELRTPAEAPALPDSSSLQIDEVDFSEFASAVQADDSALAPSDDPGDEAFDQAEVEPVAPEEIAALEAAIADLQEAGTLPEAEEEDQTETATAPALPDATAARLDAPEPALGDPGEGQDDMKAIGSLRIPIPLYNVYLNEADEWSRRLVTELSEWSLELHQPLPDNAVSLAHSLAGSSATVGFLGLSTLARSLEHALSHVQLEGSSGVHQAGIFVDVAEEIRHLLHQFAAGFEKEPTPRLLRALQSIIDSESTAVPSAASFLREPGTELRTDDAKQVEGSDGKKNAPRADEPSSQQSPALAAPASATGTNSDTPADVQDGVDSGTDEVDSRNDQPDTAESATAATTIPLPISAAVTLSHSPATGLVPAAGSPPDSTAQPASGTGETASRGSRALFGDEIDVVDAIDPELFPIFEEEALELLPALGTALRQWVQRPDNASARGEVLRGLHTLKGSARLAGALHLGELAHRFETEIEDLGRENLDAAQLEPLLGFADALRANLDQLRSRDEAAQAAMAGPLPVAPASADGATLSEPGQAELEPKPAAGRTDAAAPGQAPAAEVSRGVAVPVRAAIAGPARSGAGASVRVRTHLLDRLVNQAGEVMISRSRLEARLVQMQSSLADLTGNLERLRRQLRDIEVQSESQMQSRLALAKDTAAGFDPLEFDRFTRVQELTRMMAESVDDVATVQRNMQRSMQGTEDELVGQGRQARELQRDLLRTRMVEFEGIADRLYAVARQAAKETGKPITLDITGGAIEMDRGVLERLAPAFEHLLRNAVVHGIESSEARAAAGKPATGRIDIGLRQAGNDVSVEFSDDGAGLDFDRIRDKAKSLDLPEAALPDGDPQLADLIFNPGFSTASSVTELAGRGIGMDVVRSEVQAAGGLIETESESGKGTRFRLVLPLTTAVTQVVMLRAGGLVIGVPTTLVELVRRATPAELTQAYASDSFHHDTQDVAFYWAGALLQSSSSSHEPPARTRPVVVLRSAQQRIALHVDEVLGQQEVVVKNLGPQLARLPGLSGMSVLPSGAVVLIYNPVALANVHGERVRQLAAAAKVAENASAANDENAAGSGQAGGAQPMPGDADAQVPLVMVVDDSITVRRVTQRLLRREGYRVVLASDGLQALERLQEERPALVLSDIEMPRMDGFDLVRNIRADAALHGLPIVMITSRIAAKHREHAMALGANHYLGKPYPEEELLGLVRRYTLGQTVGVQDMEPVPDAAADAVS